MKLSSFWSALPLWQNGGIGGSQKPLGQIEQTPKQPNIVFILTDDQDLHLNSLEHTPLTRKHLLEQGTFFQHHFCTVALCCPSRVSLWTGKAAHNTNVTDVNPPYGKFVLHKTIWEANVDRWLSKVSIPGFER
jgi:N-acetylglucosamine-6-sulfatase